MKKQKRIPLVPFPMPVVEKIAKRFYGIGESISKMFPGLEFELEQAGFDYEPREWLSIAFLTAVFYFTVLFAPLTFLTLAIKIEIVKAIGIPLLVASVMGFISMIYITFYPKLAVTKKVNDVEKYLPYMIHHLLIEVRSGVPLYNALVSIAQSNYGKLSVEIRRAVNEINTGKSEIAALEMLARQNPSLYFRRIMWQIVNALKSGADIRAEDIHQEVRCSAESACPDVHDICCYIPYTGDNIPARCLILYWNRD